MSNVNVELDEESINEAAMSAVSDWVKDKSGICPVCEKPVEPYEGPGKNVLSVHPECAKKLPKLSQ